MQNLLLYPLLLAALLLGLMIYCIFWLIAQVVKIISKIKFGSKCCGLANNWDVLQSSINGKSNPVAILWIVEFDPDKNPKSLLDIFREIIDARLIENKDDFYKLFLRLYKFMGYTIFLKQSEVNVDDYVKELNYMGDSEKVMEKQEFLKVINEQYPDMLPKSENILWQCFVGNHPIKWKKDNTTKKHYPVLILFNPSFGNVFTFITLFTNALTKKSLDGTKTQNKFAMTDVLQVLKKIGDMIVLFPGIIYENFMSSYKTVRLSRDVSIKSSAIKINNDDETGTYLKKLNQIKQKLMKYSFIEIVLTAFTASIHDYFQKLSDKPVPRTSCTIPVIRNFLNSTISVDTDVPANVYTDIALSVPCCIEDDKQFSARLPLMSRLKMLKSEINNIKDSNRSEMYYIMQQFLCAVLPTWCFKISHVLGKTSISTTILPISPNISFAEENVTVVDCNFWTHRLDSYLTLSITTYNNRLQCSLLVNSAEEGDFEDIITDMLKYINLLESEVNSVSLQ